MAVTSWNTTTIDGVEYLVIDTAKFRIPLDWDPSSNVFIAVAAPTGGLGNMPALVQGDPGSHAEIYPAINFSALEWDDPTPNSASWTTITPPTVSTPGVYRLNLALHTGEPGDDGDTIIDPDDYGTPVYKKILRVKSDLTGFEYQTQKVGDKYHPATLNSTPSGNPTFTLGIVSIPAQDFDWRPIVTGQTVIAGTGSNLRVDLIARLNGESSGNDVGRGFGVAGTTDRLSICDGAPAGSADSWDKVLQGNSATVHLRVERQSGSDTFTTSASTTRFSVKVNPIL